MYKKQFMSNSRVQRTHLTPIKKYKPPYIRKLLAEPVTNLGVIEFEDVLHPSRMVHAHEIIIPTVIFWHHEEPKEPVRK